MPKIICTKCQTEFKIEHNGVYVIEMFSKPPQPYKIWRADLWRCVGCNSTIIAGFGQRPLGEHYQEDFNKLLESIKATENNLIFYDYEKPRQ